MANVKSEWVQTITMDSEGEVKGNFDTVASAVADAKKDVVDLLNEADESDVDIQIGIYKLVNVVRMTRKVNTGVTVL